MRFELRILAGRKTIFVTQSRMEIDKSLFSAAEIEKVIDIEQFLERLFGYRFYINEVGERRVPGPRSRGVSPI